MYLAGLIVQYCKIQLDCSRTSLLNYEVIIILRNIIHILKALYIVFTLPFLNIITYR